jgi:hypothetical protein
MKKQIKENPKLEKKFINKDNKKVFEKKIYKNQ